MTGGRQLSVDGTSRVTGDGQARFCEGLGVKFPGATRPWGQLGGIAAAWEASQIPCDTAFGDVEAELHEFSVDSGRAPVCIVRRQAADQGPFFLADPWPAGAAPR